MSETIKPSEQELLAAGAVLQLAAMREAQSEAIGLPEAGELVARHTRHNNQTAAELAAKLADAEKRIAELQAAYDAQHHIALVAMRDRRNCRGCSSGG